MPSATTCRSLPHRSAPAPRRPEGSSPRSPGTAHPDNQELILVGRPAARVRPRRDLHFDDGRQRLKPLVCEFGRQRQLPLVRGGLWFVHIGISRVESSDGIAMMQSTLKQDRGLWTSMPEVAQAVGSRTASLADSSSRTATKGSRLAVRPLTTCGYCSGGFAAQESGRPKRRPE